MSMTTAAIQRGGGAAVGAGAAPVGAVSTSASNPRSRSSRNAAYRSASISPRSRSRSSAASRSRYSATFVSRETSPPGGASRPAPRPRSSGGTTSSNAAAIIIETRSQNRSIGSRRGWPSRAGRTRGPGIYRAHDAPARIRRPAVRAIASGFRGYLPPTSASARAASGRARRARCGSPGARLRGPARSPGRSRGARPGRGRSRRRRRCWRFP